MISEEEDIRNESDLLVLKLSRCKDWQLVQSVIEHVESLTLYGVDEEVYIDEV